MNHRSIDPKTYTRRNSKRLPAHDYRSSGAYFVTICTEKRQRVLEEKGGRRATIKAHPTILHQPSPLRLWMGFSL